MLRQHPHRAAEQVADWARELVSCCGESCAQGALFRGPEILEELDRNIAAPKDDQGRGSLLVSLRQWVFGAIGCLDGSHTKSDLSAMCEAACAFVRERVNDLARLTPALLARAGDDAAVYEFVDSVFELLHVMRKQDHMLVVRAVESLPDLEGCQTATVYWMLTTVTWSKFCQEHCGPLVERLSKEWQRRQQSSAN